MLQSNKIIGKMNSMESDEPIRDFKKNRNVSSTSPSPPINININPNINYTGINNPLMSSPTLPPSHAPNIVNPNNNSISSNSSNGSNPNMIAPTNNKLMNQVYVIEGQQKPPSNYMKEPRFSE